MKSLVYLALIVVGVGVSTRFAFDLRYAGQHKLLYFWMLPTVALAIAACVRAFRDGLLKQWLSVRAGDFTRGFVAAAILFLAAWAFTKVAAQGPRESWLARLYLQLGDPSMLRKNVSLVVGALIVTSIAEEIVWRGLVTDLLSEVIGSRRAWVWQAVAYALAHTPTMYALRDPEAGYNPVIVAGALGCGLVWGGMARRYERLLPGIFSHVLFYWTVVMMFRLWGPSV